jgi:hypothetical protein
MTARLPAAKIAGSTPVHIAVAAVAMGGWAAFANSGYPPMKQALAALVQGALSGTITFVLKRSLEAMSRRLRLAIAWLVPPLVTCAVVLAVLVGAHLAAGTPAIWRTIAVPYAVSSLYAWVYAFGIYASRRRNADEPRA